jgi:prepilin-type N-terminal cleavage/methylation domain-containing protein/prepilin-type processing-associated H-X9-DG protein
MPVASHIKPTIKSHGFTLVELLVVVAIIALLITLILPSIGAMLDKARQAQCSSNQRQVGAALMTYAAEREGRIPVSVTQMGGRIKMWPRFLAGTPHDGDEGDGAMPSIPPDLYDRTVYLPPGNVYGCPSNPTYAYDAGNRHYGRSNYSFAMHATTEVLGHTYNIYVKWPSSDWTRPHGLFTSPGLVPDTSRTIMGGDSATLRNWNWGNPGPGRMMSAFHPRRTSHLYWEGFLHLAHRGRANVMFFDGHVENLSPEEMNQTMSRVRYVLSTEELEIIDIEAP